MGFMVIHPVIEALECPVTKMNNAETHVSMNKPPNRSIEHHTTQASIVALF